MNDVLENEDWISTMNEEIEKIERNKTWSLVSKPRDKNVIGTKWVFRNKLDENGEITRNKARLVCKWYAQEESRNYGKTFAPIARLEEVRTLLSYSAYKGFKIYQRCQIYIPEWNIRRRGIHWTTWRFFLSRE